MLQEKKKEIFHDFFTVGIIINGIDGVLEFFGGMALLFVKSDSLSNFAQVLFRRELAQDPTDFIANYFISLTHHISAGTITFAALFLVIHGLIKITLVLGLWYEKRWMFPFAGIVIGLLVVYQIISILKNHSGILLFLTIIDILILISLRYEYKRTWGSS